MIPAHVIARYQLVAHNGLTHLAAVPQVAPRYTACGLNVGGAPGLARDPEDGLDCPKCAAAVGYKKRPL